MSLALATLIYEWRRYLAAVVALALSGLLVLVFIGFLSGIVHSVFASTERAPSDIVIMPVKASSIVRNNVSLPARIQPLIYLNPEVIEVASFEGGGGMWVNKPRPGHKQVQMFVQLFGVDPVPGAATLPLDYPESVRIALMEPGAVAADASAIGQLGVQLGDTASINGKTVKLRAILHNYQDVDSVDVIASRDTMQRLGMGPGLGQTGPLMVRIKDPTRAAAVRNSLNAISHGAYHAWTKAEFNQANETTVMGEPIVGALLIFAIILSVLIGIGITSQTLRSALMSNIREFASLRALGISMGSLRLIVVELSAWVGVAGLGVTAILTVLASLAGALVGLPMVFRPGPVLGVSVMMMSVAVISGAFAMGILKKSQPADLLR